MKIQNNQFFVVQTPAEAHAFASQDKAIEHLREQSGGLDPETEDVSVAEVSFGGGDWTIKELPWQQIALKLLQGE